MTNLRAIVFVLIAAFFVLGPIETQVLHRPARSSKQPYLPMDWHMYRSVGTGYCQVEFTNAEDDPLMPDVVARAFGKAAKGRKRFDILASEAELPGVVKSICAKQTEVHAHMRCAPSPAGAWRIAEDGAENLCARKSWASVPAASFEPDPDSDAELEAIQ